MKKLPGGKELRHGLHSGVTMAKKVAYFIE